MWWLYSFFPPPHGGRGYIGMVLGCFWRLKEQHCANASASGRVFNHTCNFRFWEGGWEAICLYACLHVCTIFLIFWRDGMGVGVTIPWIWVLGFGR